MSNWNKFLNSLFYFKFFFNPKKYSNGFNFMLKKYKGPFTNDVTHSLRFLTPPSPFY